MIIPLNLIKPNGLLSCGSILLVQYLNRITLVGQVGLKWNVVFNHHIRRLHISFELGYMEEIVHTRQS
jgi:hypothetical protein